MADAPPPPDAGPDPVPDVGPDQPPAQLSPVPFLVALVLFILVAGWAFVSLRDDAGLELVRPAGFEALGDDSFRVVGELPDGGCAELSRVQVDLAEDQVFVEYVVDPVDDCTSPTIIATVTLPQPIGDRRLVAGAGRLQLPCQPDGASDGWTCADR